MAWKNILFDLDGTLIDPVEGITGSARHAIQQMGHPPLEQAVLEKFIGPPLTETFAELCQFNEADCQEAIRLYKEHFAAHSIDKNVLYPGVEEMFKALVAAGRRIVLATTKPINLAETILENFGLTGYFTHLAGSEVGHTGRPKDEIVKKALEAGGLAPADSVMVGDRRHDVAGAHKNGLPCVGVLFGYGGREELTAAGAEYLAEDVPQLAALLLAH